MYNCGANGLIGIEETSDFITTSILNRRQNPPPVYCNSKAGTHAACDTRPAACHTTDGTTPQSEYCRQFCEGSATRYVREELRVENAHL